MRYIDDITNFIFISTKIEKADIIFIPGCSHPEIAETAARIWKDKFAPLILPSGRFGKQRGYFAGPKSKGEIYNKVYETEWSFFKDVLIKNGVENKAILKEDESEYTYQNAIFSKKVTDKLNLNINKAIICCQAFHARRCLMYYETVYPYVEFIVCPTETQGINKDNWYKTQYGIDRVLGELERCGSQFKGIIKSQKK